MLQLTDIVRLLFLLLTIVFKEVTALTGSKDIRCTATCESCEPNCTDGRCFKQSGECVCQQGFYPAGKSCLPCYVDCKICTGSGTCDQCKPGYYGTTCMQKCSHCVLEQCSKHKCVLGCKSGFYTTELFGNVTSCEPCDLTCPTCSSYENCTSCVDGRWGANCENMCPDDCAICDQGTGKCFSKTCPLDQYMNATGECSSCPLNCYSSSCNATVCTMCYGEYTGNRCETLNCSHIPYCEECSYNSSVYNTSTLFCSKCDNEHFGDTCQYSCSTGCKDTTVSTEPNCAFKTGHCLNGCKHRYFGKRCNETCAVGCRGDCDTESGHCKCKDGYSGEQCDRSYNTTNSRLGGGHNTNETYPQNIDQSKEAPNGALAGGVVAGIIVPVVVIIIAIIIICCILKRRSKSNGYDTKKETESEMENFIPPKSPTSNGHPNTSF